MAETPLTPLQLRFAEEYSLDPSNASAAARRAGYSEAYASEAGNTLKNDPRVIKVIEESTGRAAKKLGITKERILQELAVIAFSNPNTVVTHDEDGNPEINLNGISKDHSGATEVSVSTTTDGGKRKVKSINVKTVKTADKVAALVKLGQHFGMFKEQVDLNANLSFAQLVEASFKETKPLEAPIDVEAIDVSPKELEAV